MVVTGFPTRDEPHRGIFNVRASTSLRNLVDVRVLFLRAWRPGRSVKADVLRPADVMTALQVPGSKLIDSRLTSVLNLILYQRLGYRQAARMIAESDLLYAVGIAPAGIIVSDWARRARRHL